MVGVGIGLVLDRYTGIGLVSGIGLPEAAGTGLGLGLPLLYGVRRDLADRVAQRTRTWILAGLLTYGVIMSLMLGVLLTRGTNASGIGWWLGGPVPGLAYWALSLSKGRMSAASLAVAIVAAIPILVAFFFVAFFVAFCELSGAHVMVGIEKPGENRPETHVIRLASKTS